MLKQRYIITWRKNNVIPVNKLYTMLEDVKKASDFTGYCEYEFSSGNDGNIYLDIKLDGEECEDFLIDVHNYIKNGLMGIEPVGQD